MVLKKIFSELVEIKKELQAIRSNLEYMKERKTIRLSQQGVAEAFEALSHRNEV